jgi:hypothetical protein
MIAFANEAMKKQKEKKYWRSFLSVRNSTGRHNKTDLNEEDEIYQRMSIVFSTFPPPTPTFIKKNPGSESGFLISSSLGFSSFKTLTLPTFPLSSSPCFFRYILISKSKENDSRGREGEREGGRWRETSLPRKEKN